jgi:hypothetical protein
MSDDEYSPMYSDLSDSEEELDVEELIETHQRYLSFTVEELHDLLASGEPLYLLLCDICGEYLDQGLE